MRGTRKARLCESLNSKITFCVLLKRYTISMFKIFLFWYLIIFFLHLLSYRFNYYCFGDWQNWKKIHYPYWIFYLLSVYPILEYLYYKVCENAFPLPELICLPINSKLRFTIFLLILLRSHKLLIKKAYSDFFDAILLFTVSIICG